MPSLKDLRVRIRSVRSTQKITAAMKMVAASRLRRAQEQAEAARPYALRMERVLASLAALMAGRAGAPPLLAGTGRDDVHLMVVATSDRGLAGGFLARAGCDRQNRFQIDGANGLLGEYDPPEKLQPVIFKPAAVGPQARKRRLVSIPVTMVKSQQLPVG